ncbi:hypothetical protein L3X38_031753 [Prunus dulcis]|uniref:Uncharacterized protein n=1 Tax=Prunus dulcis TaxID=3755 RepID=A0AAD4VEY7_PRUDU|nr:hypothetical protein L3X38_031753 [Prunus dulcis]
MTSKVRTSGTSEVNQGLRSAKIKVKFSDQPRSRSLISRDQGLRSVELNPTPSPAKQFQVMNISGCFNQDQNSISYNVSPDVKLKSRRSKPKPHMRT